MSFCKHLLLFLILALIPTAGAEGSTAAADCQFSFELLGGGIKRTPEEQLNHELGTWTMPTNISANQRAAYEKLAKLHSVSTREIFPNATVGADGKVVVNIGDMKELKAYEKLFDQIWNTRARSINPFRQGNTKSIPGFDLNDYRDWLRGKHPQKLPYPVLDFSKLGDEYWKNSEPLYKYFDRHFLEYFKERYQVNNAASLQKALSQLDPSMINYVGRIVMSAVRSVPPGFRNSITLALPVLLAGYFAEIPKEIGNKILSPVKDYGYAKGSEIFNSFVNQGTEIVQAGYAGFANREETDRAFAQVESWVQKLNTAAFDTQFRPVSQNAIREVRLGFENSIVKFKPFLDISKKDFDATMAAELTGLITASGIARQDHAEAKKELDELEKAVNEEAKRLEALPPTATAEERQNRRIEYNDMLRSMELRRKMDRNEEEIAQIVAKYLLYASIRGIENKPERTLRVPYESLFDIYLDSMPLDKLQKAWVAEVNNHTIQVKAMMKYTAPVKTKSELAEEGRKEAENAETIRTKAEAELKSSLAALAALADANAEQAPEREKAVVKAKEEVELRTYEATEKAYAAEDLQQAAAPTKTNLQVYTEAKRRRAQAELAVQKAEGELTELKARLSTAAEDARKEIKELMKKAEEKAALRKKTLAERTAREQGLRSAAEMDPAAIPKP